MAERRQRSIQVPCPLGVPEGGRSIVRKPDVMGACASPVPRQQRALSVDVTGSLPARLSQIRWLAKADIIGHVRFIERTLDVTFDWRSRRTGAPEYGRFSLLEIRSRSDHGPHFHYRQVRKFWDSHHNLEIHVRSLRGIRGMSPYYDSIFRKNLLIYFGVMVTV